MTTEEALALTRIAKAAWPAQKWDEYTIDLWVDALADTDFGEARDAVRRLVKQQTFASVAEIIAETKAHRRDAIRRLKDRETFRAIESARDAHERDRERAHAAYLETRAAFDAALAAKHPESEAS